MKIKEKCFILDLTKCFVQYKISSSISYFTQKLLHLPIKILKPSLLAKANKKEFFFFFSSIFIFFQMGLIL